MRWAPDFRPAPRWTDWGLILGLVVMASGALSASAGLVFAQESPDAHSVHHPPAVSSEQPAALPAAPGTEPTASQVSPKTPAPASIGGMGEMMGGMMGRPTRQFYPSLMDMPALTPETRQFIEREAEQRLSTGVHAVTTEEKALHNAMAEKDPAAMQKAAARVREGLLQIESGAAALRALGEGREPRQIALNWFKGQLSLPIPDQSPESHGPLGLSWFHLVV